jgi:translation initiation factor 1
MNDRRLVYSTESGRICPECGKPVSTCSCKKKAVKAGEQPTRYPAGGTIRIQKEAKGRKGKIVTAVYGVPLENGALEEFAKTLKRRCGAGGSVKEGVILIQGDHRKTLLEELKKQGYTAKPAGG